MQKDKEVVLPVCALMVLREVAEEATALGTSSSTAINSTHGHSECLGRGASQDNPTLTTHNKTDNKMICCDCRSTRDCSPGSGGGSWLKSKTTTATTIIINNKSKNSNKDARLVVVVVGGEMAEKSVAQEVGAKLSTNEGAAFLRRCAAARDATKQQQKKH